MFQSLPSVFRGLSGQDSEQAERYFEVIDVEASSVIMVEGEQDQTLAFINKGAVEVWMGETKIGSGGVGDVLGEMELFYPMPRVCSVTASTAVTLYILRPENFAELCAIGNPVVYQIERASIRRLGDQLRRLNAEIAGRAEGTVLMLDPKKPGLLRRLFSRKSADSEPEPVSVLLESEMFNWAPPEIVGAIAAYFEVMRFDPDTVVCEQGEDGDRMYVIAEGDIEVVLYTDDDGESAETIGQLRTGHAFGDSAIVMRSARSASCIARSESRLLAMDRPTFLELHDRDDPIGSTFRQGMIRNLAIQLVATSRRYLALQNVLRDTQRSDGRDIWR